MNGVSKTARVRLRYCGEVSVTTTGTSTISRHVFAANSLYDPDQTGVGNQPVGFDEWMNLYQFYTVVGGTVKCDPIDESTSNNTAQYFALGISDSSILSGATVQSLLSNCPSSNPGAPFSRWGIARGVATIEEPGRTRSVKWKAGDVMGMAQSDVVDRATLQGSSSTSPSDLIYATLLCGDVFGAASSTQGYLVTMEFDVVFTGPKQLTIS